MQLVTPILRKSIALITSFIFVGAAIAQQDVRLVKGVFTEKVLAEISVNKGTRERSKRIAEFKINPSNQSFVFAIPDDSVMNYSVQIKFMKTGAHHPVLEKMSAIPLSLEANHSYSLAITPSLLNTDKKQGWEL